MRAFLAVSMALLSASAVNAERANSSLLPSDKGYTQAATYLRKIVVESLRDPDSAKIKEIVVCAFRPDIKVGIMDVNARNGFGGYSGFNIAIAVEHKETRRTLYVNLNPSGREELDEQREVAQLLKACDGAIKEYDAAKRVNPK
jgi:hypothetical protein